MRENQCMRSVHGEENMTPLRAARAQLGVGAPEMARLLHVSLRTYQRWEAGTKHCPPGVMAFVRLILEKRREDHD
jgi:DNA-binding transcriptional regulator YiaG